MQCRTESDAVWSETSALIARTMGLHFPRERWPDLQRGVAGAGKEFGFDDAAECAEWLLSAPPSKEQLQVLAGHLTISETYFFRESKTFEALARQVLPRLIRARAGRERRLRIWSAACCTGEEAYSLAILLRQVLPDLADWQATILATDINPRALRKAVAGSYGEWSFRDAPPGLKERYFNRTTDGRYVVVPEIKAMVRFEHLNLADDVYPALATDTNAMDVIFCRNALMYFTPAQIRKVIGKLRHALLDGGWLAVSSSEASQELFSQFATRNFPGVILYEKSDSQVRASQAPAPAALEGAADFLKPAFAKAWAPPPEAARLPEPAPEPPPAPREPRLPRRKLPPTPYEVAVSFYDQGCYGEATGTLIASAAAQQLEPRAFSLLARALANQGRLSEALAWCDRWIAADKVDSAGHYLRAVVLLEKGEPDEARRSLQCAVYLQQDFVLAHFALGNLARSGGKHFAADKHFRNAMDLLARIPPDDPLRESDGLTAGRLAETITALTTLESTR